MYKEHSTIYILAVLSYRPIRGGLVCQVNLCSINSKQAKDKLIMNMDCYEYKKHGCSIHIMDTSIKLQRKYGSTAVQSDSRITIREHKKLLFTKNPKSECQTDPPVAASWKPRVHNRTSTLQKNSFTPDVALFSGSLAAWNQAAGCDNGHPKKDHKSCERSSN